MWTQRHENGDCRLELNCCGLQLRTASIGHSAKGTVYRCSCGPLTDDDLMNLERAANQRDLVRLVFSDALIVIADIWVRRPEPGWAQIEGRLVAAPDTPSQRRE